MAGSRARGPHRTLTPAVLASTAFTAACAVFAIVFVAARGGLQMPVAATQAPVAVASEEATDPVPSAPRTPAPSPAPSSAPAPTPAPPVATAAPTPEATPGRTSALPTLRPNDPLAALPECRRRPGCFVYVIQRGDTLTGIADKFLVGTLIIEALNPELTDPRLIVTGQTIYLGLSRFVRLEPCRDAQPCSLYEVGGGDSLAEIAERYGLTAEAIRAANPEMSRPISAGDVLRLPHPPTP